MKNYIVRYGLIGGIVSSILGTLNWFIIAYPYGVEVSQTVGYASIAISLLCIPFGVIYFRDKKNEGRVSFGQAVKIGLGITVVAAVVMAIHSIVFFALQKEEFLDWQKQGLSGEELIAYNEQMASMPEYAFTPIFQGLIMFLMVFLIGAVINLVSSLILKKE